MKSLLALIIIGLQKTTKNTQVISIYQTVLNEFHKNYYLTITFQVFCTIKFRPNVLMT